MISLTDPFLEELANAKLDEFGPETAGLLRNLATSLLISRSVSRTFLEEIVRYEKALDQILDIYNDSDSMDCSPGMARVAEKALGM